MGMRIPPLTVKIMLESNPLLKKLSLILTIQMTLIMDLYVIARSSRLFKNSLRPHNGGWWIMGSGSYEVVLFPEYFGTFIFGSFARCMLSVRCGV